MLDQVISGGQTGADQAALRAARACGIATGGFAPRGWLVETTDGRRTESAPWLADLGLIECDEAGFKARTRANVHAADATIWFGDWRTPGANAFSTASGTTIQHGGFTDHVFALCHLLGYRFAPRIRDLADKRLAVIEKPTCYPA
jgi:hypothetical protein